MRELLRYVGYATSADNIRISPEVFNFTTDERKQFVKGFADVTGYIRRSNYAFKEPNYRVYFEIPNIGVGSRFCKFIKEYRCASTKYRLGTSKYERRKFDKI